ncbi:MAG: MFS transporter [Deltaproteobacteria bacterium]|nr:MFS transporter [Deltaproteobacteria bacterium]
MRAPDPDGTELALPLVPALRTGEASPEARPSAKKVAETEGSTPAVPEHTRWRLVLMGVAAGICCAFQIGKAPPALQELQLRLGISLVVGGWVLSALNVVGAACGLAVGAAGDRVGDRRARGLGLACAGAGSLLGAAAPGPAWLLTTRALEGFGYLMVVVSAPALIFKVTRPGDLGLAFGLWGCFMPLGTSAMMLLAPPLLALAGWRGLWAGNGLLLLFLAAVFRRLTRTVPGLSAGRAARTRASWRSVGLVAVTPGPVALALSWAMYTMSFMVLMGFLPTLLMGRGYSRAAAAALTSLAVAVNMVGALLGGWLLKRRAPRWALMTSAATVGGLSMLGIYGAGTPEWVRYALCLLFSIFGGIQAVCVLGGAPLYAPRPTLVATTNGFVNQVSNVAMLLGPPAAALLASARGGWQATPWILTSALALSGACALVLRGIPATGGARKAASAPAEK